MAVRNILRWSLGLHRLRLATYGKRHRPRGGQHPSSIHAFRHLNAVLLGYDPMRVTYDIQTIIL
jgi:hypothetical protein